LRAVFTLRLKARHNGGWQLQGQVMAESDEPGHPVVPTKDTVDAEFTDAEVDPWRKETLDQDPTSEALNQPAPDGSPSKWRVWSVVFGLGAIGAAVYLLLFRDEGGPTKTSPPGWNELGQCTDTVFLDSRRLLSLSENLVAELSEGEPLKRKDRITLGSWSYDETSKEYTIKLNDEQTSYYLLSKDSIATCILVKGKFGAANLNESWFSYDTGDHEADD
jgi:hypothetical protein